MTMTRTCIKFPPDVIERVHAARDTKQSMSAFVREATEAKLDGAATPPGVWPIPFTPEQQDIITQASSLADQSVEEIVAYAAAHFARQFVEAQLNPAD